ncbi:MAG: uracil-DNA glycosylase family protein [Planctomycetaceae bacterium]
MDGGGTADRVVSRRGVRQYLRSLELAGVTAVPRHKAGCDSRPSAAPADSPPAVPATPIAAVQPSPAMKPLTQDREQRTAALEQLAGCVAGCVRCGELARSRTQTVFGVGDPEAKILFVGEAPGADEDRQGEPFVGRAGKLLDKIIAACKMRRDEIYICNILKCRPPGNRNPTGDEAANCREYLDGQIAIVNPEYIVCWGSVAAKSLLESTESIGRMRGRFYLHGDAKVLCTYHPSYLLRNPAAKKDVWDDMKFLFADMGVDLGGT